MLNESLKKIFYDANMKERIKDKVKCKNNELEVFFF